MNKYKEERIRDTLRRVKEDLEAFENKTEDYRETQPSYIKDPDMWAHWWTGRMSATLEHLVTTLEEVLDDGV